LTHANTLLKLPCSEPPFGFAPAESDIQRHFHVSAPSVHQMIKTLERRGFIAPGSDFNGQALPRSIRVLIDLT